MAYVNSSRSLNISVFDRLGNFAKSVKFALHRRGLYNQTVRELNTLTERELADLGIHASMIRTIAKEAAYGK